MKRSIIVWGLLLTIIFNSTLSIANNLNVDVIEKTNKAVKFVSVGYNRDDKKELFGGLSDIEIRKVIEEVTLELLQDNDTNLENTKKYSTAYNNKLMITVQGEDEIIKSNLDIMEHVDVDLGEIEPFGIDEEYVEEWFEYAVSFKVETGAVYLGYFLSQVQGVVNRTANYAFIDDLTTEYIYGSEFLANDNANASKQAYTIFVNPWIFGTISEKRLNFNISTLGDITKKWY